MQWPELRLAAEQVHTCMDTRIALENRVRQAAVDPAMFDPILEQAKKTENAAIKTMTAAYRSSVPDIIKTWAAEQRGVGEKSMARLLGHLGHPIIATPHCYEGVGADRKLMQGETFERSLRQLWQYCGHGAPIKRRKGMSAEEAAWGGSPQCKMIVHEHIAVNIIRTKGPLAPVYYRTKQDKLDQGWTKGHAHNHGIRMVGKEFLRELYNVSRGD